MDAPLEPVERLVDVGSIRLAIRELPGPGLPCVLLHGLASNARLWDMVARYLNQAGHHVIAADQRGHGHSDKPDSGYSFDETTADLKGLIDALHLERPIIAGQSWGGNVVLDFAARYPDVASGVVLVDGGFLDLQSRPEGGSWEQISVDLRPPDLAGRPRDQMLERMRAMRPDWPEETLEMRMANFEVLEDGTIRPWLTVDRHMQILRALWEQRPAQLYPKVQTPVLIAVADHGDATHRRRQAEQVAPAEEGLANVKVRWFFDTAHDIHVNRPLELAEFILWAEATGFFAG